LSNLNKYFFWWEKNWKKYKTYNCIIVKDPNSNLKTLCNKNWKITLFSTWNYWVYKQEEKIYNNLINYIIQKKIWKIIWENEFNKFSWYNFNLNFKNIKKFITNKYLFPQKLFFPKFWMWDDFIPYYIKLDKLKKDFGINIWIANWFYKKINIDKYFFWWENTYWKKLKTYNCIIVEYLELEKIYDYKYKVYCKNKDNKIYYILSWNKIYKVLDNVYNYFYNKKLNNIIK